MASLRKTRLLGGGYLYFVDFRYRGQRIRKSCKTSNYKLACAIRDDLAARIARGTFKLEEMQENDISLEEFKKLYIATCSAVEKAEGTQVLDARALDRLMEYLGENTVLRLITKTKAEKFRAWMVDVKREGHVGRTTANMDMRALRAAFNWAKEPERRFVDENPFDKIRQLKVDGLRPRYMTPEELKKLIDFVAERKKTPACYKHASKFELYLHTVLALGSRRTETTDLRWKHLDLEHAFMVFEKTKNDEPRTVPIGETLLRLFKEMRAQNPDAGPDDLLFKYHKNSASRAFSHYRDLAGISKEIKLHGTRHTYATLKATAGVPLLALKDLLGHRKIETTMQYAKILPDALRAFQNQATFDQVLKQAEDKSPS